MKCRPSSRVLRFDIRAAVEQNLEDRSSLENFEWRRESPS